MRVNVQAVLSEHILTRCDLKILRSTDGWSSARTVMDGRSHVSAEPNYKHQISLGLAFTIMLLWFSCNKKLMDDDITVQPDISLFCERVILPIFWQNLIAKGVRS